MATRKTTKKTATNAKAARASKSSADSAAKALAGKAQRGKEWDPSKPEAAAPSRPEVNEPRPYTSRYPIPDEKFKGLKEAAKKAKVPQKKDVELSKDKGKKEEIAESAMAVVALEPAVEPVSTAPSPSTNFAGMPFTGWIPPDCTLAAGASHVLVSANSSVAVYNKVGGPAVLQKTLTAWFSNVVTGLTIFDPKTLYDQHAGRWVLLAVAVGSSPNRSYHLLSVSSTSNPLGPWRNY